MNVYVVRIQMIHPPKSSWTSVYSTKESAQAEVERFARDNWAEIIDVNFAFGDYTAPRDAVRVFFTHAPYKEKVWTKILRGPNLDEGVVELSPDEIKVIQQALYTANYNEIGELTNIPKESVMSLVWTAGDKLGD